MLSLFMLSLSYAQKAQTFAYIDMDYILENIPEYQEANQQVTLKVQKWQVSIAKENKEIDILKTNLDNERALLTPDLITDREEDIAIRQEEVNKLQEMYFGTKGDLYRLRKQFVKPVQDQVYNAIQDIAKQSKYDFVLDKSSDLIMLYSNTRFDISERVVRSIVRTEKKKEIQEKKTKKQKKQEAKQNPTNKENPEIAKKLEERANKRKELLEKIEAQKAARLKAREDKKKEIEAARQKIIDERNGVKPKTEEENKGQEQTAEEEKQENIEKSAEKINEKVEEKVDNKTENDIAVDPIEKTEEVIEKTTEEISEEAIKNAKEVEKAEAAKRIEEQNAAKNKLREERLKAIEDARQKKLKQREEARKKIEAKRDSIIKARNNPE